jgi:hypothetical protein
VSESSELRGIYGPCRDEVTGVWRKRHKKELHHLYSSTKFSRVMNSRKIRWPGNAASTDQKRGVYRFWW